MTKTTKDERNEIRLLEARATMGPWLPSESTRVPKVLDRDGGLVCEFDTVNGTNDREAVAAMRNIFPDLLADLDAAEAERDAHKELIDAARYDVGERSFLEDAQNILKECVAAYSCEQMQAVAKALRQWRDKWAILLETVVRTCEDRDDMMAQRDALKAKVDTERQRQNATLAKLREELGADLGCGGGLVEILTGIIGLREQRDALKAKLADPRRVVIHGQTLLDAVKQIVAERKAAVLWAEKAEKAMTCKGCGGTVSDHLAPDQGGCPGSFEIDGVQMVPLAGRDNAVAQRDRAEADLATLRADRDAALIHLPVCCGSLADAADTLQQERDELAAERDDAKAKLAALANAAEVVAENYEDFAGFGELDCLAPLHAAIAAARGGAS